MALTHPRRMTADEFLSLPPDDTKTQLIDGELVELTDARLRHQLIGGELFRQLANWLVDHPGVGTGGIGCNWRMDDANVFIPDVWFLRQGRLPDGDRVWLDGAPDLALEVRSESTWRFDRGRKKDLYLARGAEVWLVDTAEDTVADTVAVHRADHAHPLTLGRGATLTTPLLPGFALDLTTLFDR